MNFQQRCMKLSRNLRVIGDDLKKVVKRRMGADHVEDETVFMLFVVSNNPDVPDGHPQRSWVSYLSTADRQDVRPMLRAMLDKWDAEGNASEVPLHERQ